MLLMVFEPQKSGVRSKRSTMWAATTASAEDEIYFGLIQQRRRRGLYFCAATAAAPTCNCILQTRKCSWNQCQQLSNKWTFFFLFYFKAESELSFSPRPIKDRNWILPSVQSAEFAFLQLKLSTNFKWATSSNYGRDQSGRPSRSWPKIEIGIF